MSHRLGSKIRGGDATAWDRYGPAWDRPAAETVDWPALVMGYSGYESPPWDREARPGTTVAALSQIDLLNHEWFWRSVLLARCRARSWCSVQGVDCFLVQKSTREPSSREQTTSALLVRSLERGVRKGTREVAVSLSVAAS